MSIKCMNRVWEMDELKGGRLLLMLALADHANDAGECWPSQPHLAKKARLNERQVRRVIDSLVKDGYLAVIEKGVGRNKRPHYRLFLTPVKADILSETTGEVPAKKADILSKTNSDILSAVNSDISDTNSDILSQEKRTFLTGKADISDRNYSHARSEPPIEPSTEPSEESSFLLNEDDEPQRSPVQAAWWQTFQIEMSPAIQKLADALVVECGEAAVIHGIGASATAKERTFAYIAKCARNYIPPAPEPASRPTYAVELPGVYALPATAPTETAKPLPPPMAHDDPWAICLSELRHLPGVALDYLRGSRLEAAGDVGGVPLYRVVCEARAAVGLTWLTTQAGPAIRRKVGSVVGRPVLVELVTEEMELTP